MPHYSLQPVIDQLTSWRVELVERLRAGDENALELKLALDRALAWLEVGERRHIDVGRGEIVQLPIPQDYEPFGEYRILWDGESEDRSSWREVLRAAPGDLLVRGSGTGTAS